jgi:hypothetical protein
VTGEQGSLPSKEKTIRGVTGLGRPVLTLLVSAPATFCHFARMIVRFIA